MIIPKYSVLPRKNLQKERRSYLSEMAAQNRMFNQFQKNRKSFLHKLQRQ